MNILYAVSEATPFIKTGGLADVAGSLPKALNDKGTDTRVILPLYGSISEKYHDKLTFCMYTFVHLAWRELYCGLFKYEHEGVTYYFIDNEYYFKRESIYGQMDDGERFAFFSKAVVEILPLLDKKWKPDIINCNDWQTALIPMYLHYETSDYYNDIKSVFTIHNIEYQGRFPTDIIENVFGLPFELYENGIMQYENSVNIMKGAIYKADAVTTVSESYAHELHSMDFACGLQDIISENDYKLTGIINGLDTNKFNPATDNNIAEQYTAENITGKISCKIALCRNVGFDENENTPIIACVSRLVSHKGFNLVSQTIDRIVDMGARVVILGTGDEYFENRFKEVANYRNGRVSANITYSEQLASMIYAGSDMILMPSKSEPCGLSQLIAMRYGTIPIVHEVGGLRDTVHPYGSEYSNGFSFYDFTDETLLNTIRNAISVYNNKDEWKNLMFRAMTEDLSWGHSANKYIELYKNI